jgi:acyl-CoA reductase-like NAD-dependent aldehyde dehydrogenase
VFNLVCGSGPQVGEALVTHPVVSVVSLTGSVGSGARVGALGAAGIKRVRLELGGKSPNLVLDDADLEVVIPSAIEQAFFNGGQACNALSRLLVPRHRLDEVEERLIAGARAARRRSVRRPDDADDERGGVGGEPALDARNDQIAGDAGDVVVADEGQREDEQVAGEHVALPALEVPARGDQHEQDGRDGHHKVRADAEIVGGEADADELGDDGEEVEGEEVADREGPRSGRSAR